MTRLLSLTGSCTVLMIMVYLGLLCKTRRSNIRTTRSQLVISQNAVVDGCFKFRLCLFEYIVTLFIEMWQ